MAYRIKHGINTAVSLALVVAEHTDEETGEKTVVEQEQIFLPGAVLPANFSPRQQDLVDNGDPHLTKFIEQVDGEPSAAVEPAGPVFDEPTPEVVPEPVVAEDAADVPVAPEPEEVVDPVVDAPEAPAVEPAAENPFENPFDVPSGD